MTDRKEPEEAFAGRETQCAVLRDALRAAIGRTKHTAEELSVELGRHPTFVGRLLRGNAVLRVEEVFHLLAVLDIPPQEVLFRAFPLGGFGEAQLAERHPATFEPKAYRQPGDLSNRDLVSRARWNRGGENPSSVALALQAGQVLRALVHDRDFTLKQVAASLGRSPKSLGSLLSGRTELTFETVFRVLEEIDVSPGRYFLEMLVTRRTAMERMRWNEMLDYAEEHRRLSTPALGERVEARRRKAERADRAGGEED